MVQWWRGASLQTRLLVRLATLFCVIAVIFVFTSVEAVNASTQQALEERQVLAQLMADRVDAQLGHALALLQGAVVEEDQSQSEGALESVERQLAGLFDHTILFKRIFLLNTEGVVHWLAPYSDRMMGVNLAAPPYNAHLAEASGPIFEQATGFRTEQPGVAIMYAIQSRSGSIVGYISGWIDLSDPVQVPSFILTRQAAKATPTW